MAIEDMESEVNEMNYDSFSKAVFDGALDGILLADVESGRFVNGNNMICRMLGYSMDELKRISVADIHPAEHLPYVTGQLEQQVRGEIALAENIPVKRKDGSIFFTDISASAVEMNGVRMQVSFFRDITERKQAGQKLQSRMDEIELMNRLMVGRELKMEEFRQEIKQLRQEVSCPHIHHSVASPTPDGLISG
jgi:PAS domain S-box-containing protein